MRSCFVVPSPAHFLLEAPLLLLIGSRGEGGGGRTRRRDFAGGEKVGRTRTKEERNAAFSLLRRGPIIRR